MSTSQIIFLENLKNSVHSFFLYLKPQEKITRRVPGELKSAGTIFTLRDKKQNCIGKLTNSESTFNRTNVTKKNVNFNATTDKVIFKYLRSARESSHWRSSLCNSIGIHCYLSYKLTIIKSFAERKKRL